MSISADSGSWIPVDSFGHRLVLVRHELGLTQQEAADRCGIQRATWGFWEAKGASPRRMHEVVATISNVLGVDRHWLMWGSGGGQGGGGAGRTDGPTPGDDGGQKTGMMTRILALPDDSMEQAA